MNGEGKLQQECRAQVVAGLESPIAATIGVRWPDDNDALLSLAHSMKRIADVLEGSSENLGLIHQLFNIEQAGMAR